jgi:4-coumarate--CoA ligase
VSPLLRLTHVHRRYNSYLNNPQANKEVWYDGGWVRTGDEVILRKSGDIYIVDRLKEILKVNGFQVAPAELEGYLLDHEAIADVGVVGIPDDFAGELPAAFVQLQVDAARKIKGDAKAEENLKRDIAKVMLDAFAPRPQSNVAFQYVADNKVEYKQLRGGVYFVDSIPKNPSGKILRRVLRDMVKGRNLSGPANRAKL